MRHPGRHLEALAGLDGAGGLALHLQLHLALHHHRGFDAGMGVAGDGGVRRDLDRHQDGDLAIARIVDGAEHGADDAAGGRGLRPASTAEATSPMALQRPQAAKFRRDSMAFPSPTSRQRSGADALAEACSQV